MRYAAQLIDQARKTTGLSQNALAGRMKVTGPTLSQWRNGVGSPMPPERVIELCDLAGVPVDQRDYWLIGVQRDAVTITSVRRALDVALDRLRPAVATVGLLALCAIAVPVKAAESVGYGLALPVNAYYVQLRRWLARRLRPTARSRRFDGRSGFLSCPAL